MLLQTKAVRKRTVWSVNRFLEPDGKILIEVYHLWSLLADQIACNIVGVLVREYGGVEISTDGHVVHGIRRSG